MDLKGIAAALEADVAYRARREEGARQQEDMAGIERMVREAETRIARELSEAMFPPFIGPPEKPKPVPWRTRLRWRWYAVREWLAVKVLRVDIPDGDDW